MPPELGGGGRDQPRLALILAVAVALLWPTLLNWHPYLFWDTYGYFLQGKAYSQLLLGWSGLAPPPPETGQGWIGAAGRMLARDPSIRSPTWSLLTYGLAVGSAAGFWLLALFDALVAAATLELTLVRLFGLDARRRLLVLVGMTLLTPLPWFASYLMPDLYAGLLVLAAALLVFAWGRLTLAERIATSILYLGSISFHLSHVLLAAGLLAMAVLLPLTGSRRLDRLWRLALPLLAAVALLLGVGLVGFGAATLTPIGAPFLLARAWEDGPVRAYLERACPSAGWAICPYLGRVADTAQEFLWRPHDSYWAMDLPTRAALRAEEPAIVLRAVLADPLGQIRGSLANLVTQLGRFGLEDLVLGRGAAVTPDDYTFVYLPSAPAAVWGLAWFTGLAYASTIAAAIGLVTWWMARRDHATIAARQLVLSVLGALVLNAAVCGILSGPQDRYQGRVIWLLPLLAAALLLQPAGRLSPAPRAPSPSAP
ncbi:MAG: hypothetical protein ACJ8H8_36035 [Geminicoccaceae bacterium]